MGSAQSTRGCALPPLMWSRHGRQARLLICMALSWVLPGSMLVAHGSLPQPSAPAAAAASSAAAMCEEAGGPPHRCRPAPAATGFPSLLLPLSTCCQYLHRVKKVCLSRTLMNKSPAGQGRMTTRRQRCGRHVAHVALTKSFNVPPPQLRGSRCRVHVNSPRLRIAKTALSGHHHAHAHRPLRSLRLPIRCPIGSASPCNQRQAPGGR